ncbi:SPOR domain-containing protein, partial [Azospirillum doebereinerae]|uniref:SPOR domain-containing protein n=1 Tax=Azospirillum doebereinerae TaxID=92933 RepID=UPI001EE50758
MKYEGDVNYATDPYGAPPPQGRSKRGLFALGFAVVGIVAFAGTVIVGYRGGDRMSSDGPPLLTADPAPTKSRPDQPGGMEVPHQDKLVYQRLNERANGGNHPSVERLLPPPETPLPRPVVTPPMPAPPPMPAAPTVAQLPPPPPGATSTVPRDGAAGAPPSSSPLAPAPAASTPVPAKPAATAQPPKPPASQPAVNQPAAKPPAPAQQQAA